LPDVKLTPEAQQMLIQHQTFQQQLQTIMLQKESISGQSVELEMALTELKKADAKEEVYKAVGSILIKSTKSELEKELREKKETIEVRLKTLDAHENKLREKMKQNQEKLEAILKNIDNKESN